VIAHVAGLPVEETIPQLAPMVVGAVVAARLLRARARSWVRPLDPGNGNRGQVSSVDEKEAS
jgi:hypothetical protein